MRVSAFICLLLAAGIAALASPTRGTAAQRMPIGFMLAAVEPEYRRLPELERMEREVTLGVASSFDLHFRLLPDLREIARARLERVGKVPSPETLGRWWELLSPDRPAPDDRFAKGISEAELRALVADLEKL